MKVQTNHIILLVSFLVFILSPYLPNAVLNLTAGNRIGSFALIAFCAYVVRKNIILGIAAFLGAASLFLENRRRTVARVRVSMEGGAKKAGAPVEVLSIPARDLIPGEIHPRVPSPYIDEYEYDPSDGSHNSDVSNDIESNAVVNDKTPLETVPSNNSAEVVNSFQNRGLAGSHY